MRFVNQGSLYQTIDRVNEALFSGKVIPAAESNAVCTFIASRFGLPGGYCGLFAPAKGDSNGNVAFFTGEPIKSGASISHILGEESMRVLKLLSPKGAEAKAALRQSVQLLKTMMRKSEEMGYNPGTFCCGNCTSAYWRNLLVNKPKDLSRRLDLGLKNLKGERMGNGKWKRYPFFHTVLVLTEMHSEEARTELRYAAPALERAVGRQQKVAPKFRARREALLERVLEIV